MKIFSFTLFVFALFLTQSYAVDYSEERDRGRGGNQSHTQYNQGAHHNPQQNYRSNQQYHPQYNPGYHPQVQESHPYGSNPSVQINPQVQGLQQQQQFPGTPQ